MVLKNKPNSMPCIAEHGESWLVRKLRARTGKSNERNGQGLPITDWHRNTKSINSYIFGKLFSVLKWKKNSYFTITYILAIIKRKNRKTLLKIHKINFIPKLNSKFHVLFNIYLAFLPQFLFTLQLCCGCVTLS